MAKLFKIFLIIIILTLPSFASGTELLETRDFFVDPSHDLSGREKITAVLQRITNKIYFYLDNEWWAGLDIEKRKDVNTALAKLSEEFENTIYPGLTQNYGSEWKPGIDGDERITILVHPMKQEVSGYFRPGDEYPKVQIINSNEKEMVYLSSEHITDLISESYLAHEFTHLITFNQKEIKYGVSEETWLNESRAEYAPTLLGYDRKYQGSNLQKRVKGFLENPRDSITEWKNKTSDYGVLNLFTQYLADHYGKEILIDSLKSGEVGIASLNQALNNNGFEEDFSQIFTDWTITVFVNDCSINEKYCYLNDDLKGIKVTPFIYYLPTNGDSTLSIGYLTKDWSGNWQKIIGTKDNLKLDFAGSANTNFKIPYIVSYYNGNYSIGFMELNTSNNGNIYIEDGDISSLTIIPSTQKKMSNFTSTEPDYQFYWSVTTENESSGGGGEEKNEELIEQLKATIAELEAKIVQLQAQIAAILGQETSCQSFNNNLYYGMMNNIEVRCLQEFLKNQGAEIYPEGLVTGNFLTLTKVAAIRFQEKYREDVLTPIGLKQGTGYVGVMTRAKINELLGK